MPPTNKRFSTPAAGTVGTPQNAIDDETTLNFFSTRPNAILDVVNDPDPTATDIYRIDLWHGSVDTGKRWFSGSISPASAGRLRPSPVKLSGGQYQLRITQTAGTAAVYHVIIQFANEL